MKTRTVVERVGENMGPIDWSYDFRSHFDTYCCSDVQKEEYCQKYIERLRQIVEGVGRGEEWVAEAYGCDQPVADVGMYDGWPFWRPVPSVALRSWLGIEWHPFSSIKFARARSINVR